MQKEAIVSSSEPSLEPASLDTGNLQNPLDTVLSNNLTRRLKFLRISLFDLANINFKERGKYREYLKAVLELEIIVFNKISQPVNNESYNEKLFLSQIKFEFEPKITLFLETIARYLHNDYGDEAKEHLKEVFESFGPPLTLINLDLIFIKVKRSLNKRLP